MPMIDLKRSKSERKDLIEPSMDAPEYPWGLNLNFDAETLEKLGKTPKDFEVGEEVPLVAVARVTSISQHDSEEGGQSSSVGLVITQVEGEASDDDRAETLFGGK